ncbi:hypothetical protein Glove_668g19 [Diversispora epigaea]|uniref:Amino acid transporter transmembrane domain-containing protein n=1 Tax=Diversispora epigaea TaxID=1348612 RepID=A0A397G4V1_9GLOM|nr:hypothetical protein Glove_668g19 [Diversispora epigaea]
MVNKSINLNNEEWPSYGATLSEGDIIPVENDNTKGSNWTAYVNVVCLLAGSGTLGITYAIKQGGWISVIILMFSAIISTYSNIKLIECLYYDRKTRKTSMSEIAYNAFGNVGLYIVSFFFNALALGCPILYLILAADNSQSLFSNNYNNDDNNDDNNIGINIGMKNWVYIWGIIMFVPFVLLKTMKEAAWLSIFGSLTTALVVVVVSVTSVIEYPNNSHNSHDFINIRNIPIALATFSFSYGGNVVYPHVEASMKNPQAWPKVISFATFTVTLMYFIIGIPSYLTYGQNSLSPIYFNLPVGFSATISIIMITAHVLLALPIYQTAFAIELENYLGITVENLGKSRELIWRIIIRTIIMIFMIYCAINLPYFSDFMALLGAMGNGVLLNFMPIVVWLKLFGWNQLNGWKEKIWVIFALILSSLGAVIGTWDALIALWLDINR